MTSLSGKNIMVLVANGVDETVMSSVQRDLLKQGASVKTVGLQTGLVSSWNVDTWGLYFPVDQQMSQTLGADFDALVIPSGARATQKLATTPHTERIISSFVLGKKPMLLMGDDAAGLLSKVGIVGAEFVSTLDAFIGQIGQVSDVKAAA